MPPKLRQAKLPRRVAARSGEMDLETAAAEQIDAITAEPLQPNHFIEILSPDKTLRLFYNTSTLVRIANDKGGFMQPPHFREPMQPPLIKKIEEMEGRRFRFEKLDTYVSSHGDVDALEGRPSQASQSDGLLIHHRHVYFDQIIDEFYHLNSAEVYVCPVCYQHYVNTRYIPYLESSGARVDRLDDKEEQTPVIDPLDVLCYMLGGAVDGGDLDTNLEQHWDNPLAHIVFRRAVDWKRHMKIHHDVADTPAADYRLRDVLCTYHSQYNRLQDARHADKVRRYGDAPRRLALTQQRYWQLNARYNCLRYNRVVEAAERAEGHSEAVDETAFPGETIAQELNPADTADADSDFVVDDSAEDSADGSNSDGGGFFPRFEGADLGTDSESSSSSASASEASSPLSVPFAKAKHPPGGGRKRDKERSSRSSSSTVDVEDESSESSSDDDDETDSVVRDSISKQRALFSRGLLKETDMYYQRLSAEDRHFVSLAARQPYTPSRLYDPVIHRKRSTDADADDANFDEIDWEDIGGDLTSLPKRAKAEATDADNDAPAREPTQVTPSRMEQPAFSRHEEDTPVTVDSNRFRSDEAPLPPSTQHQRLLLDEEG